MKRILFGFVAALSVAVAAAAFAATGSNPTTYVPGQINTSPVVVCGSVSYRAGPQSSGINACGGTFTCVSASAVTVANSYVDANSVFLFGLNTAHSPGNVPYVSTVTVGTSFAATCASGDTSVYNYIILG